MYKMVLLCVGVMGVLFFLLVEFVIAQNIHFSDNLRRGSSGTEVTRLQEFLKTIPDIYPEGMITGYFGALTEKAVKRFQSKYGIEQVGNVGPKTRAKLNSLPFPQSSRQQMQSSPPQPWQDKSSRPQEGITILKKQTGIQKQQTTASVVGQFTVLEKELMGAQASGQYLSPAHSSRIQNDLTSLEKQNYDAAEIKRLRAIVFTLSPHIQDQSKLNAVTTVTTAGICKNSHPMLTADITDFSKIQKITTPGSSSFEGPKGHSFVWTNGQYVPVYAPIAGIFDSISYSKDNAESPAQYMLVFNVKDNCNYQFKFDHIDEPIAAIKAQAPSAPKVGDSQGIQATEKIEFRAGDLLGFTRGTRQAGNWDFGLYDISKDGVLAQYGSQGIHKNAVCWVDFYSPEKQTMYRNLLEGSKYLCSFGGISTSPLSLAPTGSTGGDIPSGKPLVIKNLGVSFEPLDKNTNRAGAFIFSSSENKVFLEYGVEVQDSDGNTKILPTFEYRTAKDADVFAASDGVITKIVYQPQTQDYEILIQPEKYSEWTLGHDHVGSIRVSEGNSVKAGDVLGKAGTLGGAFGRTEIMIWRGNSSLNRPLTYCPFKLFAPELLSEYQQKVSRHMREWEEFKGNPGLYTQEKHVFAGCLRETIFD